MGLLLLLLAESRARRLDSGFSRRSSYNDNLSNSEREADEKDDFSSPGTIAFGRFGELTDDLRLTVTADIDARAFARFEDFNS